MASILENILANLSQVSSYKTRRPRSRSVNSNRRRFQVENLEKREMMSATPLTWNDFNGDHRSDLATYQVSSGVWSIRDSATTAGQGIPWGGADQVPVPGMDFDGDSRTDLASYRVTDGMWSIRPSSGVGGGGIQWGGADQLAVGGVDFDGDGKTDLASYRKTDGLWSIRTTANGVGTTVQWGGADQSPVGGIDFDGDGKTDLASYRKSDGVWSIRSSATGVGQTYQWGGADQIPVGAIDFDGDRKSDLATYQTSTGVWSIRLTANGAVQGIQWGGSDQTPVGGFDYDGDGKTDLAAYQPATGTWSLRRTATGQGQAIPWGGADQIALSSVFSSTNNLNTPTVAISNPRLDATGVTKVSASEFKYGTALNNGQGNLTLTSSGVTALTDKPFSLGTFTWYNAHTSLTGSADSPSGKLTFSLKVGAGPNADVVIPFKITSTNDSPQNVPDLLAITPTTFTYTGELGTQFVLQITGLETGGATQSQVSLNENTTAAYRLMARFAEGVDFDDQIAEAHPINVNSKIPWSDKIDVRDVDMFSFQVTDAKRVAFDVDSGGSPLTIRVFDSQGKVVKNSRTSTDASNVGGQAPREANNTLEGYLEVDFAMPATYYVAISGNGNASYNPLTGNNDANAATANYSLTITPVIRNTSPIEHQNLITGALSLPNPNGHRATADVELFRIDANGNARGEIARNTKTWVVMHGRTDDSASFKTLATELARQRPNDQVLLMDWADGAFDNRSAISLDGAEWIPPAADWAAGIFKSLAITGSQLRLVGHSWGSYMAYDIGRAMGRVQAIVALDPATAGMGFGRPTDIIPQAPGLVRNYAYPASIGYAPQQVNFSEVSNVSWAFYGGGEFGSALLAGTATESFKLDYAFGPPTTLFNVVHDPFAMHRAPVEAFTSMVHIQSIASQNFQGLFSLSRLESSAPSSPWRQNMYSGGSVVEANRAIFEATISVFASDFRPGGLRYFKPGSLVETKI